MREILISIKQKYSQLIYNGLKTVELRKKIGKEFSPGRVMHIYTSTPEKKLTGEARIAEIICTTPEKIKTSFLAKACISQANYDKYFEGCDTAYAIILESAREYKRKISLSELRQIGIEPPQSFCYIDSSKISALKE